MSRSELSRTLIHSSGFGENVKKESQEKEVSKFPLTIKDFPFLLMLAAVHVCVKREENRKMAKEKTLL
jgi:hypothetical protein